MFPAAGGAELGIGIRCDGPGAPCMWFTSRHSESIPSTTALAPQARLALQVAHTNGGHEGNSLDLPSEQQDPRIHPI